MTSECCHRRHRPRGESVCFPTPQAAGSPGDSDPSSSLCRLLSRAPETPSVRPKCGSFLRPGGQLRSVGNQRGRAADALGPFCSAPFQTRSVPSDTTSFPSASLSDWAGEDPAHGLTPPSSCHTRLSPADDRGSYFIRSLGITGRGLVTESSSIR